MAMDDIDGTLRNITRLRGQMLGQTAAGSSGEWCEYRDVWVASVLTKERDIEQLKMLIAQKTRQCAEFAARYRDARKRVDEADAHLQNRLALQGEQQRLRMQTLETENGFLAGELRLVQEHLSRQAASLQEQKRQLEQEAQQCRAEQTAAVQELHTVRARVWELERQYEVAERLLAERAQRIEGLEQEVTDSRQTARQPVSLRTAPVQTQKPPDNTPPMRTTPPAFAAGEREDQHSKELEDIARGFSHKVRNYLGIISGTAQLAVDSYTMGKDLEEQFLSIDQNAGRMLKAVEELMELTRRSTMHWEPIRLRALLNTATDGEAERCRAQGVTIALPSGPQPPPVQGDAALMERAVTEVLANALDAMPQGGEIRIGLGCDEQRGMVAVTIMDTGAGIADKHRERIYQPYYTTRKGHQGLGLTRARRIVDLHQGLLLIESAAGQGTTVTLLFPIASKGHEHGTDTGC